MNPHSVTVCLVPSAHERTGCMLTVPPWKDVSGGQKDLEHLLETLHCGTFDNHGA